MRPAIATFDRLPRVVFRPYRRRDFSWNAVACAVVAVAAGSTLADPLDACRDDTIADADAMNVDESRASSRTSRDEWL